MRHSNYPISILSAVFLALIIPAPASNVEISGTLQNVNGFALPGKVTVITQVPDLTFSTHIVEDNGQFQFTSNSSGELVIHASSPGHPSDELVIGAGATGSMNVSFVLPLGQDVQVRVVDDFGHPVPDAQPRVRYHEPHKSMRRVSFDNEDVTDGDGRMILRAVGIDVPFVVDVLASKYAPISSPLTKLTDGETQMEDINIGELAATVVVQVRDYKGINPVADATVTLLSDPASLEEKDRESWLHHHAYRQKAVTSKLGNVQFTGVPSGKIAAIARTASGTTREAGVAKPGEETRITLEMP